MSACAHRFPAVLLLAAALVFALCPTPVTASFRDTAAHWADDAISALAANGVLPGFPDNTFKPDRPITRAEFAEAVATAFGVEPSADAPFADLAGLKNAALIQGLAAAGIMEGYPDGTFRPDDPVSRAEAAAVVVRAIDAAALDWFANGSEPTFSDVPQEHRAYAAVEAAAAFGILPAFIQGSFLPDAALTRAEAAWLVYHGMRLGVEAGTVTFADPATQRLTLQTEAGRIRDFRLEPTTRIIRADAPEALDGLAVGETVRVVADRYGTPRLVAAEAGGEGDLTQQLARTILEVFTPEELQKIVAGDWSVAATGLRREAEERLAAAGVDPLEIEALLNQDWTALQQALAVRVEEELAESLSIPEELAAALLNQDWAAAKEQAQLAVAQHVLNFLLSAAEADA